MDKTALKSFAIYSREKLIKDIKAKAILIGITEEGIKAPLPESTRDMLVFNIGEIETYKIYGEDVNKYDKLIKELEKRQKESDYKTAYKTLIEEVAYTWFNRIIAIRFMEVNNYMPDKMRVLSSGKEGVREPEFVTHYRDTDIGITEEEFEKLDELKLDGRKEAMDELFQFMFIKQCNALNKNLPELFEKTDDYAELLLNISYEDPQGIVRKLIEDIGEDPFDINKMGQIEIIGWLYQYYNTVLKAEVDASNKKVDKNTLPPKTQLFTPEWIVKYMVQNSLGRLWIERKTAMGTDKTEEELAKEYGWKYYLPEAEQVEEVKVELKNIRKDIKNLKVEDITFIDPSMGSGHILVYAFEMFMQFYLEEGYMEREAAESIIENNLYGLDIDKRAYQLAYFAIMMKGRQYSRRILNKDIENNLYYFIDSKDIDLKQIDLLGGNIEDKKTREDIKQDILEIVELFKNGRELGSVIKIDKKYNYDEFIGFIKNIDKNVLPMEMVGIENIQKDIIYILELSKILSKKYNIVVTNPPYLGRGYMGPNLARYVDKKYEDSKTDLFAVFMRKSHELLESNGYYSMINQQSWMFLHSYDSLRDFLLYNFAIINALHLGPRVFEEISGEVVQSVSFVMCKKILLPYKPLMIDLTIPNNSYKKEKSYLDDNYEMYQNLRQMDYLEIPNSIFMYRLTADNVKKIFKSSLDDFFEVFRGPSISSISKNVRRWYEVDFNLISNGTNCNNKWGLCDRSGSKLRWKIPIQNVISIEEIKNSSNYRFQDKKCIIWPDSRYGSVEINARFKYENVYIESGVNGIYTNNELDLHLVYALFNIGFYEFILAQLINGQHFSPIYIKSLPYPNLNDNTKLQILELTKEIDKTFNDLFTFCELNWEYESLLSNVDGGNLELEFINLEKKYLKGINIIKDKELELYNMLSKLMGIKFPQNLYNNKSKYSIDKFNRLEYIKSFISYGVGCIFGRYSLDEKGLVYAGGEFDINRYNKFKPVEDNVVLITDKEYFEDDLVNRFVEFVKVSFGEENLEENLKFIADSLKGKGTPREKIRNYFVNDFYKDHTKMYKKIPIYWLYDSGKQNGFKALIYMHRYNADTTGKVRIDYLHKVQRMYERRMDFLRDDIANNKDAKEVAKSEKKLEKIIKQVKECKDYDEKITHIALSRIEIDLDDGVKVNYKKVQTDDKGKKYKILAKI